jgi:hypothetical protein
MRLMPVAYDEAETALSGRYCFSGQSLGEPQAFAARKRAQGLRTRITQVGGRFKDDRRGNTFV